MVTCAWCGAVAEGTSPPLTWTTSVEGGATRYFCAACTRQNVRGIESKLDSTWW